MQWLQKLPSAVVVSQSTLHQIPDFSITAIAACQLGLLAPMLGVGVAVFHRYELPLDGEREMGEGNIKFRICRQEGRKNL